MEGFQRTVLIVAVVMLIISLIALGTLMRSATQDVQWPPQTSTCPDYWSETSPGQCLSIHNQNVGESSGHLSIASTGLATPQQRCEWAMKNKVVWDGITDGPACENL